MRHIINTLIFLLTTTICFSQDKPVRKIKVYLPTFKKYKVDNIYTGKAAQLNFNSNTSMKLFRTVIRNGYRKNKLNFGGHYC